MSSHAQVMSSKIKNDACFKKDINLSGEFILIRNRRIKMTVDVDHTEEILVENKSRHVMYPIKYKDIFAMYKKASSSYWVAEEVNFQQDLTDIEKLTENEKFFIFHILAFFAASDGIVNENLGTRFMNEVMVPEARAFYGFQIAMEQVHSEVYSLLIDTYVKDEVEKDRLYNAVKYFPAIKEKADWALRWIEDTESPFAQRLIAFALVEGLFFSASFCAIFWLRERGLLPGLSFANQLISRDEGLHTEFACLLYSMINNRISKETVEAMVQEAVEIEMKFITESIPCRMIGMNEDLMKEYIKYVADRMLLMLGYEKIYHVKNPFSFMEAAALDGVSISNFFELKVSNYSKAGVSLEPGKTIPTTVSVDVNDDF
jgi:ribonucleotide reductase beta subunit family protein with ferritin-like domain